MKPERFIIMYEDYPVSLEDFYTTGFPDKIREHNRVYLTNSFDKISYFKSYDLAMSRLHLIRDAINETNIRFSCDGDIKFEFGKLVSPNDFYVARVCLCKVDSSTPLNRPSI